MLLGLLLLATAWPSWSQRPVWNIGHMVNDKRQIDEFLDLGANAVETDFKFSRDGSPIYTSHGFPCDCGRNCFRWDYVQDFLEHVSQLATPGNPRFRPELVMVCLDLKMGSFSANEQSVILEKMAINLINHLWKNGTSATRLNVLFHLPDSTGISAVTSFFRQLTKYGFNKMKKKIGWDVYSEEPIEYISKIWENINSSINSWQGDGITNCLPRSTWRLREAVAKREKGLKIFTKVYYWTVDRRSSIRDSLRIGVDAVVTNYPNRVVSVLQEPEFQKEARLATSEDNAFELYRSTNRMAKMKNIRIPNILYNQEDGDNDTALF